MAYSILRRDDEQPDYSDGVYASQTAEAMDKADRLMKQEAERRARAEEEARARIAASNDNATAQGGTSPGGNFGSSFSQFAGSGAASSMTPTAAAQASGKVVAHAAPYAGANAAGAGGSLTGTSAAGSSSWLGGLYANPYAWIAALAIGNELNADHEGRRDMDSFTGESAITGRSFYRDRDHMREQGNKIFDGWGDDIGIAANFSSPIDLFRGDTWSDAWDSAKRGGTLGGIIRKIF